MAKKISITLGIIFLLIGILGFFPNPIAGMNALFVTNHAHDLIHIITGLVFIIIGAAYTHAVSATLKTVGIIYLIIAILGFFTIDAATGTGSLLSFVLINKADNWLHIVLAILVFAAGILASKGSSDAAVSSTTTSPSSEPINSNPQM